MFPERKRCDGEGRTKRREDSNEVKERDRGRGDGLVHLDSPTAEPLEERHRHAH